TKTVALLSGSRLCSTSSAAALPEGRSPSLMNDEFLKDGLQSVSRQKILHTSQDKRCPVHTLHSTCERRVACRFVISSLCAFYKPHAPLSLMLTITTSTYQIATFSADRFNP
uniref:Uncharacterized protein n=1 Tax=Cynoglossus semilaevis TaxID=244447 RepID=A0A3P8WYB2_CYNSE